MNKFVAILLLLLPVSALNLTVSCSGDCIAYIPTAGHAVLNYTVNGSKMSGVFTKGWEVNFTGALPDTIIRFNLTKYGCENPAEAFVGLDPLETARFDSFLLAKTDLSPSNTTIKLFCNGFNDLEENANWFGTRNASLFSTENITYNGTKTVLSGLRLDFYQELYLNETHAMEIGRSNATIVNRTSQLNASFYDNNFNLVKYFELGNGNSIYTNFGNAAGRWFFVLSHGNSTHGNITIVNESFGKNATITFNRTGGVAIADTDKDGVGEIVACANITDYNVTVLKYTGSWTATQTNVSCSGLQSFDSLNLSGINQSIITFNSTGVVAVLFNKTVSTQYTPLANIVDLATYDVDNDGSDEVAIAFSNGDIFLYNVSLPLSLEKIDYLGRWNVHGISETDDALLIDNGSLLVYGYETLPTRAKISYKFESSAPQQIQINFLKGGTGNITLNVSAGSWVYDGRLTSNLTLNPTGNGTIWINFTLIAQNSTGEPWIHKFAPKIWFANTSLVNNTQKIEYFSNRRTIHINSTLHSSGNFTILGADFSSEFNVSALALYLKSGTQNFWLDGPTHTLNLWKPTISTTKTTAWFNSTPVQASQQDSNFSTVVGYQNYLYFKDKSYNISTYGTVKDYCVENNLVVYTWGNATVLRWDNSLTEIGNITGNFTECWIDNKNVYLVNSTGGVQRYNLSLSNTLNFTNSSFIVQDIAVVDSHIIGWNGTHLASLSNNKFTLQGTWGSKLYLRPEKFIESEVQNIEAQPSADLNSDKLWERIKGAVYSVATSIAKLFTIATGKYSWHSNQITSALNNGTVITYSTSLPVSTIGTYTSFTANTTHTSSWIITNYTHPFRLNITVSGFYHNSTDTLTQFIMNCTNSTKTISTQLTKYANNSFTTVQNLKRGKYACIIFPKWEAPLPKTFAQKEFTLYVDGDTPIINNISYPKYISSTKNFNITVNVTDDGLINQFTIHTSTNGKTIIKKYLIKDYPFKIYKLELKLTQQTTTPYTFDLNISATDYFNHTSANFTLENVTIYDSSTPSITLHQFSDANGYQYFNTKPLNISAHITSDANLSYANFTVWLGSSLVLYQEYTNINDNDTRVWLNTSALSSRQEYTIKITTEDITGNSAETTHAVLRYPSKSVTLTTHHYGSNSVTSTLYWFNNLADDSESGSGSPTVTVPDMPVDNWNVKGVSSSLDLEYVQLWFFDKNASDITVKYYAKDREWGVNATQTPNRITVYADTDSSVTSTKKMCLMRCSNYNVASGSCSGTWVQMSCGSSGDDTVQFNVSGSYTTSGGVGFYINITSVSSSSTTDTTQDTAATSQTTTQTTSSGTAVISITGASSINIEVGQCQERTFTIKNTGDASASITKVEVTGLDSAFNYSIKSGHPPHTISADSKWDTTIKFCANSIKEDTASFCVHYGTSSKCKSITLKGINSSTKSTTQKELKLNVLLDKIDNEYIVTVNSTQGLIEGAEVVIVYADGTNETFQTNAFGKVDFTPKMEDFTVKVNYDGKTAEASAEDLTEKTGLDLWRVLLGLLIVGVLLSVGILLDEQSI